MTEITPEIEMMAKVICRADSDGVNIDEYVKQHWHEYVKHAESALALNTKFADLAIARFCRIMGVNLLNTAEGMLPKTKRPKGAPKVEIVETQDREKANG